MGGCFVLSYSWIDRKCWFHQLFDDMGRIFHVSSDDFVCSSGIFCLEEQSDKMKTAARFGAWAAVFLTAKSKGQPFPVLSFFYFHYTVFWPLCQPGQGSFPNPAEPRPVHDTIHFSFLNRYCWYETSLCDVSESHLSGPGKAAILLRKNRWNFHFALFSFVETHLLFADKFSAWIFCGCAFLSNFFHFLTFLL